MTQNGKQTKKIQELLEALDWVFGTGFHERCMVMKKEDIDSGYLAEITYRKEYQDIEVAIYPSFFKESLSKQRKTILHEMCHVITIPSKSAMHRLLGGKLVTSDQIHAINEEETSKIENIFDSLLRGRMLFARKAYAKYIDKPKVAKKVKQKNDKNKN
jgi:hypothetical protein